MFHKFTNFIQQTVDAFSPNIAPQEEFVYHWKSVTNYFLDNKDGGARIEETALPEHLMSMLRILQEEESNYGEAGTTGACLEYLLQHRLLETLYTLGRTDHPPGMKQLVLSFFTKTLSRISHPLLPHINVHRAIQRMVKACGETRAAPTEKEEIEFLCTVCAKIKTDPYLVNFFIESPKRASDASAKPQQLPTQTFSLVDALLTLSHSEDARVSVKACEGLMLCASLPEHSASNALIYQTQFCQTLSSTLCQSYEKLPLLISPDDIMTAEAKWGFDDILERNDQQSFQGKPRLISFLSWLDYCDQLIAVSNPAVGEALAREIHKQLLTQHFLAQLVQPSESGIIIATFYLNRCLRTVNSPALLKEFCFFLLGDDRTVELKESAQHHALHKRLLERCNHVSEEVCLATLKLFDTLLQKEEEHIYHRLLIRNLLGRNYLQAESLSKPTVPEEKTENTQPASLLATDQSNTISSSTDGEQTKHHHQQTSHGQAKDNALLLQESDDKAVSEDLANSSEAARNEAEEGSEKSVEKNIDKPPDKATETTDQDQSKTSELKNVQHILQSSTEERNPEETVPSPEPSKTGSQSLAKCAERQDNSQTMEDSLAGSFGRSEVHKVVNCFLSLLPEEAKSSYQTADTGYDMYLRDAHKQYSIQDTVSKAWGWPKRPVALEHFTTQPFYEGSFLHMLMDKLLHLLDQSYSVNLLLTALIARVALIPHPNLHEFLLEPFLPTAPGTRTLYTVLTKVANDIKHHQKTDPSFFQKLLMARKQLLGMVPTIHSSHYLYYCHYSLRRKETKPEHQWFEDQGRMEAIIVLEEFCKELSAITFVKHHAAVTRV
ncbi:protein fam160b1-like [Plakobranchus ocellatus]|uniref:Protein fam160b1-like n=1 Tax=Plakobranchus ocellatus TaxID=259542 RepID=A0AAV4ADU0_9GAST|nr:protein fam160b1-like [Plakobranchus ocellatus]